MYSELGRGTRAPATIETSPYEPPGPVIAVTGAKTIAEAGNGACAIGGDDRVYCWGNLFSSAGSAVFETPAAIPNLRDAVSLGMSGTMYCAIKKGGTVACWGWNDQGQLGDGTKQNRGEPVDIKGVVGAKQLAIGLRHGCALTSARTVVCWGTRGGPKGGRGGTRPLERGRDRFVVAGGLRKNGHDGLVLRGREWGEACARGGADGRDPTRWFERYDLRSA